ncbi:MAG: hypothetical protein KF773_15830 [Deltaproteobacteria bacterium]|nr:hypothetical protein [Deltaproteobacteria bacterium]
MRAAPLLVLCLASAGCPGVGPNDGECIIDMDCDGDVCARDHACHPADQVRAVKAQWTIRGQPASELACAGAADLYIRFKGSSDDALGYAPVPCRLGQFTMDKLPTRYFSVELGVEGRGGRHSAVTRAITSDGVVTFDLKP